MVQWTNQNLELLQHKAVCATIMSCPRHYGSRMEEAINYGWESWEKASSHWYTWWLITFLTLVQFSSVAQSCPSLCDPHESQHARPPCSSPTPGAHPNPCPLSRWCHPTISSSLVPFSSCPQSFPASGSFQMSQPFASGARVLEFQLQHQSFQWTPRTDLL